MVRQAREMIAQGDIGKVRVVQVEYPQDWLTQHEDFKSLINKEVLLLAGPLLKTRTGRSYRRRAGVSENE